MEGVRKITASFMIQYNTSLGRDSTPGPTEYKASTLTATQ